MELLGYALMVVGVVWAVWAVWLIWNEFRYEQEWDWSRMEYRRGRKRTWMRDLRNRS